MSTIKQNGIDCKKQPSFQPHPLTVTYRARCCKQALQILKSNLQRKQDELNKYQQEDFDLQYGLTPGVTSIRDLIHGRILLYKSCDDFQYGYLLCVDINTDISYIVYNWEKIG